jgi:hypothetical protein
MGRFYLIILYYVILASWVLLVKINNVKKTAQIMEFVIMEYVTVIMDLLGKFVT